MNKPYTLSRLQIYRYKKETNQSPFSPVCMAPLSNLLFVPSGKVMACHYNRGTVLGDIRTDSIKDIWQGKTLNQIRTHLSSRDFSFGCQSCYNELISGNYYLAGNYKYKHLPLNKNGFPSYFDFQLENTCNLQCIMCSSEYSSAISGKIQNPKLENPYNENFIHQLDYFIPHLKAASFTGGEPFMIKSYRQLWQIFAENNPNIPLSISTNASFIPKEAKSLIENGNFQYTVSIDSLDKNIYESIRKNAGYEKTMENINYLHQLSRDRHTNLTIKIVVMTMNQAEMQAMIEYWSEKDIEVYPKLLWVPVNLSLRNIPSEELELIISNYKSYRFSSKTKAFSNNVLRFQSLIKQLEEWKNDRMLRENRRLLEKLELPALMKKLTTELSETIINDFNLDQEEKSELITLCEKWVQTIIAKNEDKKQLKTNLENFILLGTDVLIAEIKRNPDMLAERFRNDILMND